MAIFHMEIKNIGRSEGRSAIAAAAYRSGSVLVDEVTGEVHNYSKKQGVDHTEIMTPDDAPFWVKDRSILWNTVQDQNTRKNSRYAKEANVALPKLLSDEAKITLVREFVTQEIVNRFGLVCDVCWHDLDSHNPHVHLMIPLRVAESEGFGARVKAIDHRKTVTELRAAWARHANHYLSAAGEREITEKSYEERGIDRLPEIHFGAAAWELRKKGIPTEIEIKNRAIKERNRLWQRQDRER
ncbi:MAG: MobQ family relaxase [Waterburya sp.]